MTRRLTQDEVIEHFRDKHGDFYDYSKFVYSGNKVKGIIICPSHGEFSQQPYDHKRGRGCPRCKVDNQILSHDEVIEHFRDKHGDFYDYSKFVYANARTKGIIICPIHGEFLQTPDRHKSGQGCPRCANNQILSKNEVIRQFREVHENNYDYSKFMYSGDKGKGIIICPIHGEFEQIPKLHKNGHGCPQCAHEVSKGGYDSLSLEQRTKIKDVYLYHLELQYGATIFHKIGITGNPRRRFYLIQRESKSTILNGRIHMYKNAEIAFNLEQKLLDRMMFDISERYYHPIKFGGSTECFLPIKNMHRWNLDLRNIPKQSKRFNYNETGQ